MASLKPLIAAVLALVISTGCIRVVSSLSSGPGNVERKLTVPGTKPGVEIWLAKRDPDIMPISLDVWVADHGTWDMADSPNDLRGKFDIKTPKEALAYARLISDHTGEWWGLLPDGFLQLTAKSEVNTAYTFGDADKAKELSDTTEEYGALTDKQFRQLGDLPMATLASGGFKVVRLGLKHGQNRLYKRTEFIGEDGSYKLVSLVPVPVPKGVTFSYPMAK